MSHRPSNPKANAKAKAKTKAKVNRKGECKGEGKVVVRKKAKIFVRKNQSELCVEEVIRARLVKRDERRESREGIIWKR